ncbi:hypothetical protein dsx2_2655 [Desulfovibrio sp. X2]|uniref:hypothetical protein n=1 Tax=Desulfovibrio sp. X2 TaxID=941449 RepID=UPI000358CD56|nr:hypothetical protein [Desulfovibrio sp. X2]EPR42738.1 hypothetical protein dsx2_2655 [Desulfovibrio sp. X2]
MENKMYGFPGQSTVIVLLPYLDPPEGAIPCQPRPSDDAILGADGTWGPSAPSSISRRQIRIWMAIHGIPESDVLGAIAALDDETTRMIAKIAWEESITYERTDPILQEIATGLGYSDLAVVFAEASEY